MYLNERVVLIKFINMGVDAYWGSSILENAATALPILEDLIGVPLPSQVESVEIYGMKKLGEVEWAVGFNDGNLVALKKDFPNPTHVFHELVHFWTIHYSIPWPLAEGYCDMYADLCAAKMGLLGVTLPAVDWRKVYLGLASYEKGFPLNSFDYHSPTVKEEEVQHFYLVSEIVMYNFYTTVGEENLKLINQKVAQSSLDASVGGIGIAQYLRIVKEVTGINYANLFMPVVFGAWQPADEVVFQEAVARYCAVSELTKTPDSDEQMKQALAAMVNGNFSQFQIAQQAVITSFYEKQKKEELPIEQEIIYPEKKTGIFSNKLLIFGIIMLVVVVTLLVYIFLKLAREEEEEISFEDTMESKGFWTPPKEGFTEKADTGELPEIPDLQNLTK